MELNSVILIPVPDSNSLVRSLRRKYDPGARKGVPPHITILFPFYAPDKLSNKAVITLKDIFRKTDPIEFSLSSVATFPNVVYLKPNPLEPFIQLTEAVVNAFPDKQPYEDMFESINPHLTIAQVSEDQNFKNIKEEIINDLTGKLPLHTSVNEAWIMVEDEQEHYTKTNSLPFY